MGTPQLRANVRVGANQCPQKETYGLGELFGLVFEGLLDGERGFRDSLFRSVYTGKVRPHLHPLYYQIGLDMEMRATTKATDLDELRGR